MFLKHATHLQKYEKQLVMQASLAEVVLTSSVIPGLQANPGLVLHGCVYSSVYMLILIRVCLGWV